MDLSCLVFRRLHIQRDRFAIGIYTRQSHIGYECKIGSRNGGQLATQCGASSARGVSNASNKGGFRNVRVTEHVGKEWRRWQIFERCVEMEGADSVGEFGAGRNGRKQFRF